ncbi:acyl-CoA dehydrogenase family protein [Streptomyces sp. NPDC006617]|uniref:acyl-CoA dehydrogenase family protein n=1 Tax=Streptomyces sp. NPDC006617 TaxID=3155354 RepID=UPI0033B4CF6B
MSGFLLAPTDTVSEVREVAELAARHAAVADHARRLPEKVMAALVAAGFARHFVPVRWGGRAGGFVELLDRASRVGEGCTSAAWIAVIVAGAARMGVYLPEEGQRELWSKGADTVIASALNPRGHATPDTVQQLGMALGAALTGVIFFAQVGNVAGDAAAAFRSAIARADSVSYSSAFRTVLLLDAGILLIAAAGFLTLPKHSRSTESTESTEVTV